MNLTWKQWRAVNPGVYALAARPGSLNDRLLAALTAPQAPGKAPAEASLLQVSSRGDLRGLHLTERLHLSSALTALRPHVVRFGSTYWYGCGYGMYCLACFIQEIAWDLELLPRTQPNSIFGPKGGDPVNLVTGEEEYNPATDLSVYNPHGPSVVWQRSYRSLRSGNDQNYQSSDYGQGWTQPYNVVMSDGNSAQPVPQLPQGLAVNLSPIGTDAPASGLTWDVLLNGTTVASSASPNGWTATFGYYGQPTLTPATSAQVSTGYELRFVNTNNYNNQPTQSALFDVVPAASLAPGKTASFATPGTAAPAAGLQWDIVQGSTTVATSANPNGWSVSSSGSYSGNPITATVSAPEFAPLGNYTLRSTVSVYPSGTTPASATFSVYGVHYAPAPGIKSLSLPNGAIVACTAPAVPTASSPHVSCAVQPGVPLIVDWYYAPGYFGGYFVVTMTDRTKWVMTPFIDQYYGSARSVLSQVIDRNGNAINMVYGGLGGSHNLPLLSAITDNTGNVLLSIGRSGSAISSVSDAYGRSVFYQNSGAGLTQVSQIVPTGTASTAAPFRYTYSYIGLTNPEGEVSSSALHTITVPSPTGTGTSMATINYASGQCNVSSIVDGNGNTRSYQAVEPDGSIGSSSYSGGGNHTKVTVTNPQGALVYSYMVGFDGNMNETSRTDGRLDSSGHYTTYTSQRVYSDPNDPYRPSAVYDGNGSTGVPSGSGPFVPQGRSASVFGGSSSYVPLVTWQVTLNGTAVASSAAPNGWSVSYSSSASAFTVGAPTAATAGSGYQVTYDVTPNSNYGYGPTGSFTVLSAGTKPPTSYAWDQYGNLLSQTSPRGITTTYTYSYANFGLGELTQAQEGSKGPTFYAYFEPSGLTQSVTTPKPGTVGTSQTVTTSSTYGSLGNLLTVTTPGNNAASTLTTTLAYTGDGTGITTPSLGLPLTVTDNLGHTTHLRYDARGNTVAFKDALGNETDSTYTIGDDPLQTILPATGQTGSGQGGSQLSYLYQEPAALATTLWPAVTLQYGPAAMATSYNESGAAIRQTSSVYGKEGETLSVSGSTEPVSYVYDADYRLTRLTDGGNHTTSYFYTPAGYLAQVAYPGAQATPPTAPLPAGSADTLTFGSYDADGNLLTRVDGRGQTTTYAYASVDSLLTSITYPSGTIGNVSLGYDLYGRTSSLSDGTGSQTFAYDDLGSVTTKTVTWTGLAAKTLTYGYYPDGSRSSLNAAGRLFASRYDGAGRMSGLTNDANEVTSWTYRDNNWLLGKTLGNAATVAWTQNALGQVTRLLNKTGSGTTLSDYSGLVYDGAGSRTTVTASVPGAPTSYSGTTGYQYDYNQAANPALNRSQLTKETSTRGSYTNVFAYDGGTSTGPGNPTSFKGASQTFNVDNQQTGTGFGYDGNGNPTTYKTKSLTFDPENRMTSDNGTTQTNGYSGDGLRAWKQAGSTRTYFLYDGAAPVCEYNSSGTLLATNTFGADGLVSRRAVSSNVTTFYTFDERGSVSQRLSSAGAVLSSDLYDGFGTRSSTGGADVWQFEAQAGYYTDAETGLILCTHRFYDPQSGRWLTRDPIGYEGGINLYGYVGNNPGNEDDPDGYIPILRHPINDDEPPAWLKVLQGIVGAALNPSPPIDIGPIGSGGKGLYPDRYNGPKPPYSNPGQHDKGGGNFRGGGPGRTTELPSDAADAYKNAIPDQAGKNWYGRGKDGDIYRYAPGDGGNHWSGREYSQMGLHVPPECRARLGPTKKPR